ncbi:MAG: PAS domain-containing protein [Candidatus Saccharibacteria bacterium]
MASLKKYTQSLALVVAVLPRPILIVDEHGKIQYANDNASDFFGVSEHELLGNTLSALVAPSHKQNLNRTISKLIKDREGKFGRAKLLTISVLSKDDSRFPVIVSIAQVLTDDGAMHVLLDFETFELDNIGKDLAAQKLRSGFSKFVAIHALEVLEDSVAIYDQAWRCQYVNAAGWDILGRDKSEVLGKNLWKVLPDLENSEFKKAALEAMQTQNIVEFEEYYPRRRLWLKTKFYPSTIGLVVQTKDITRLKDLERMNSQLAGTLEEAMQVYWDKNNKFRHQDR